jgi:hypothetical protein
MNLITDLKDLFDRWFLSLSYWEQILFYVLLIFALWLTIYLQNKKDVDEDMKGWRAKTDRFLEKITGGK